MTSITLHAYLTAAFLVALSGPMSAHSQDDAIVDWAAAASVPIETTDPVAPAADLVRIGEMIGNARIVALSEAVHGAAEPLDFRNRVFRYLVEEKSFAAIAIESGISESRVLHDYVLGGSGDVESVIAEGFAWGFDAYPQNRELIEWMRAYNADRRSSDKIRIFGFDVSGSPGNTAVARSIDTPLREALEYLDRVDPSSAVALRDRLKPVLPMLRFDPAADQDSAAPAQYLDMSQSDRDLLTASIADLVSLIERRQMTFVERSAQPEYDWAYRSAIGARQVDAFLRRLPVGRAEFSRAFRELADPIHKAVNVRARAMGDNLNWIVDQVGESAGVLVFAQRGHIAAAPSRDPSGREVVPAGAYLRRWYGEELVTIGNMVAEGEYGGCRNAAVRSVESPPERSADGLLAQLDMRAFALDLRAASSDAAAALNQIRSSDVFPGMSSSLSDAFDIIFFSSPVTPACPSGIRKQEIERG